MHESFIGLDLHFMFNYLKCCKLSSSACKGLLHRDDVDGVFFKYLQRGHRLDPYEAVKTKGLVYSRTEIAKLDKMTI